MLRDFAGATCSRNGQTTRAAVHHSHVCTHERLRYASVSRARAGSSHVFPQSYGGALVERGLLRVAVAEHVEQVVDAVEVVHADDVQRSAA